MGSLLHVDPADSVHLGALKAAGNPLAAGSAEPVDPGAVALRLVETTGCGDPRRRRFRAGQGARAAARRPAGNAAGRVGRRKRSVDLHGYQVATVLARLEMPRLRREHRPAGPAGRGRPAPVRAVLAAQPRPRATRRAARRRAPAPAVGDRRAGRRGGVAAHRGQRLQRRHAERHRGGGVPGRLDGHTRRAAVHAVRRRARGGRRRAGDSGSRADRACTRSGPSCGSPADEARGLAPGGRGRLRRGRSVRRHEAELVYLVDGPRAEPTSLWRPASSARLTVTVGSRRRRRPGAGGASDQPVGHLGVDRPRRARRGSARPRHGRARLRRDPTGLAGTWAVVGPGPGRLRRPAALLTGGAGDGDMSARPGGDRCRRPSSGRRGRRGRSAAAQRAARRPRCRRAAPARGGNCAAGSPN